MFTLYGRDSKRTCNGVTRRDVLRIGSLGALGFGLTDLLAIRQAQAAQGQAPKRHKSVILIWMHGGPTQTDIYDPKPEAPSDYRGPYKAIKTNVPGIEISEKLPRLAKVMDRATLIRSMHHATGDHYAAAHWMLTGYHGSTAGNRPPQKPAVGAVTARLLGNRDRGVIPYVVVNGGGFGYEGAAWLGATYNPLMTDDRGRPRKDEFITSADVTDLRIHQGLDADRLNRRQSLLTAVEGMRRRSDRLTDGQNPLDIQSRAMDMILSGRTYQAFKTEEETKAVRSLYGHKGWGKSALLARRLIEAGTTFVTVNTGGWDDHGNIKGALDRKLPWHDAMTAALITDLGDRGMLEDTLVVTAGEFGRTPKINRNRGRDHWPYVMSALVAGGEFRHGQVIGSSDETASYPDADPQTPMDLAAIIYHHLGVSLNTVLYDAQGRPIPIVDQGRVPPAMLLGSSASDA